jgi:hypothetical protein
MKTANGPSVRFASVTCNLAAAVVFAVAPAKSEPVVPDFNGVYGRDAHNFPKPYMSGGAARNATIMDGYNNSILKPWVVELLHRDDMVEKNGHPTITAHSVCYPESVPYVFGGTQIQILQTPTEITMIFGDPGQLRTIYMNQPHSKHVEPSWYGESVGHFEGDTLIVDTVGLGVHPEAGSMGFFGTPHTRALHLVERYRFLAADEKSTAPRPRNDSFDADAVIKGGKVLRLSFTVEDPGAYKKPWSVTLDYLPLSSRIREYVCAENVPDRDLAPLLPTAATPDF